MALFSLDRALAAQGKALPELPVLYDRTVPVSTYTPGTPREDAVITHRSALRHMQAYGGNQAIDWVYDSIGLYADPVATSPYKLRRKSGTKLVREKTTTTPKDHEVGPADLYRLLDQPNPFMLYSELLSLLVIDLLLVGNAYWLKWQTTSDGKPLALYRLAPSSVKVVPGPYGPKKYEYQLPGMRKPLRIDPEQMIHFRRPNPHDPYYGMGVIQGAGRSMDLELAVTDTMASYYENKADPSMIVQSDRRVPRDVFNKLRAQLRARTAGTKRAGELLVLEAGLKASSLSTNARDALFAELAQMSRDRILAKFRVNPMLLGLIDESSGSNKVPDARREFDNAALRPFMNRLQETLSASLTAAWGVDLLIDYRYTAPPEEAVKNASLLAALPGIKVREVRMQLEQFGIEESTGDPELDEVVLNQPGEDMDENGQNGQADRNLVGEAGRPPKGENTKNIGVAKPSAREGLSSGKKSLDDILAELDARVEVESPGQKALREREERLESLTTADPQRLSAILSKAEQKALSGGDNVRTSVGNILPGEQRPQDPQERFRERDIDAAQAYIAAELRDAAHDLERGLLDAVEGKALKTSDIVKRVKQSAAWTAFRERVEAILTEGAVRAAKSAVMHSGVIPDDGEDVDYDAIVKSTVHRPEGLRKIIRTLRDRVARRVAETRDGDGERAEFEAAVKAALNDWSASQVVTIADSEATEAYNEGMLTMLEMDGQETVFVTDGHDHDEPCKAADGQIWTIDHARANRKEHPRCRRAFLPLAEVTS